MGNDNYDDGVQRIVLPNLVRKKHFEPYLPSAQELVDEAESQFVYHARCNSRFDIRMVRFDVRPE
ncbi:MAG: hypothetical protein AABX66_00850 [Nanoarchaeota archaeon]